MLVDDDAEDREIFSEIVGSFVMDIKLLMFDDGEAFLNKLSRTNVLYPDLIFIDLQMPKISGLHLLKELKENNKLKNIPIIIYTSSECPKAERKAYELGAEKFVQKPSDVSGWNKILNDTF